MKFVFEILEKNKHIVLYNAEAFKKWLIFCRYIPQVKLNRNH